MSERQSRKRDVIRGGGPDIALSVIGTGPLMILLHGIGSSGKSWLPVMSRLAQSHTLVIPDLRGHGRSGHPESGYGLNDYADDLERIVATRCDEQPIILGHSLGGLTTITWARRHPFGAKAIVLEDMPLSGGPERAPMLEGWANLAAMTVEDAANHYRTEFPDWTETDIRRRAEIITSTEQAVFLEMRNHSMTGRGVNYLDGLEVIQSPITLIHGDIETGGLVPAEAAATFANLGDNFSAKRIESGSHSLHRDQTDQFLEHLYLALAEI